MSKVNGSGKAQTNGKPGEPAPVIDVQFFGGLWRYEVVMPNGAIKEGFRSSEASARQAAKEWIGEQK